MQQACAVIIPVYKSKPEATEIASLKQCIKILYNRPIILVAPASLSTNDYEAFFDKPILIRKFDDAYFKNIEGYNKLMLSKSFYEFFKEYKYILIYQLDAWVFRDELDYWCSKNYDYIGAPWTNHEWATFAAGHLTAMRTILFKLGYRKFNLVGNGGFSLRKVRSFIFNLQLFKPAVISFKGNEDAFFSFFINSYNPFFKIPSAQEALNFGFDINPEKSFKLNNNKLPMGCHGWNKSENFWNQFINH